MKKLILTLSVAFIAGSMFSAVPMGYYNALNGKKKEALKEAAKNAVRNHTEIAYSSGTWPAFEKTDVKVVDGVEYWWDMYSDNLVKVSSGHPGLNIEHAVANSWWGGTKNAAYRDLFHLNPSNADANNRKSNYPLGIVAQETWSNGVTLVGHPAAGTCGGAGYVYEPPLEYKGDFARAFMYIFTVYDDECDWKTTSTDRNFMFDGSAWPTLRPWAYEMLLEWNNADPVSDKERKRNEEIYKIQGNRNPFIDLPDLAEYIWGSKTNEPYTVEGAPNTGDDPVTPPTPSEYTYVGDGTLDSPYNVADIIHFCQETGTTESKPVYFHGYVTNIDEINTNFGNATFYIADEKGGTPEFYLYRIKDTGGQKFTNENRFTVDDHVVIYGPVVNFRGNTLEGTSTCQLVSVNDFTTVVSAVTRDARFSVVNAPDGITVISDSTIEVMHVYDLSGRVAASILNPATTQSVVLPTGLYIVECQGCDTPVKVMVK